MKNIHGGTIYAIARRMGIKPAELLDFSASINPLGFSSRVRTALKEHAGSILHYPDQEARDFVRNLPDSTGSRLQTFLPVMAQQSLYL